MICDLGFRISDWKTEMSFDRLRLVLKSKILNPKSAIGVALALLFFIPSAPAEDFQFTRMVAHWAEYNDPQYVPFLLEAEPQVVQLGFYGAHFWSLAHTSSYNGYPSHLPMQGHKECGAWFEEKNKLLHTKGMKVVGHFNVEFLVGDPDSPEGPRGFFKFYRDLWDEKELGPKPVADPLTMLEKNADGTPISQAGYGIGGMKEYWACLRNPDWQKAVSYTHLTLPT